MLSKAKLKQIRSLEIKKYRNELKRFNSRDVAGF